MKKLLLGAAFMLGAITVNAQDGPKVGQEDLSLYPNVEEYGIYPLWGWYTDRVGQGHYCPLPPSEPYVRVSPHTAQAFLSLCSYAETGSYYFLFPLVLRDNLKHSS